MHLGLLYGLLIGAFAAEPREVDGPWRDGAYVTVAADTSRVHAAWLAGDVLRYASSSDAGKTWVLGRDVARGVEAGDGGQIRPELLVAASGSIVAFVRAGQPTLAVLDHGRWRTRRVRSSVGGSGSLMDVALVAGRPVVVWLDTRRDPAAHVSDVWAWVDGREELVFDGGDDGVCMCCRPAVGEVDGRVVVAFRDANGAAREVREVRREDDGTWLDGGPATHGGWAPGGCPADGPTVLPDGRVLISDARDGLRRVYADDEAQAAEAEVATVQPRAIGGHRAWIEAAPSVQRLVLDGAVVAEAPGRLEPGDPVRVGGEVWLPWQGEVAHVVAVEAPR